MRVASNSSNGQLDKAIGAAEKSLKQKNLKGRRTNSKLQDKQGELKKALEKNEVNPQKATKVELSNKPESKSNLPSAPSLPTVPGLPSLDTDNPASSSQSKLDKPEPKVSKETEPSVEKEEAVKKYSEIPKVLKKNRTKLDRSPAIFFVGGLELLGGSTNRYQGVGEMAHAIQNAESFSWTDKSTMLEEIENKHPKAPIILVGHSLGGDTAVEIANELNTLERGFRRVNLLVTIDSVGLNNDIIPPNVQKNLNVFGQSDSYINDGPNVARNHQRTEVVNVLRHEGHTELDDSSDVQFEIIDAINRSLSDAKTFRPLDTNRS